MGKPKGSADARKAYLDKKARKEQARTGGVRRLFRLGGGAAAALAGLSFLYMVLHGALSEHIAEFEPEDAPFQAALKSGQPWLILCHNGTGVQDQTFVDSQGALSGIARLGTVDCNAADATGKPIVQRLRLRTRKSPVAFTTGNGMRPRQVPPAKFKSVDRLVAWVTDATKPRLLHIKSEEDLQKCQRRRACALVLTPGSLSADDKAHIRQLAYEHRTTQFAILNTNRFALRDAEGTETLQLLEPGLGATTYKAQGKGSATKRELVPATNAIRSGVLMYKRRSVAKPERDQKSKAGAKAASAGKSKQTAKGRNTKAAKAKRKAKPAAATKLHAKYLSTLGAVSSAAAEAQESEVWGVAVPQEGFSLVKLARPAGAKASAPSKGKRSTSATKRKRRSSSSSGGGSDDAAGRSSGAAASQGANVDDSRQGRRRARKQRRTQRVKEYRATTGDAGVGASYSSELDDESGNGETEEEARAREAKRRREMEEEARRNTPQPADEWDGDVDDDDDEGEDDWDWEEAVDEEIEL